MGGNNTVKQKNINVSDFVGPLFAFLYAIFSVRLIKLLSVLGYFFSYIYLGMFLISCEAYKVGKNTGVGLLYN